MIVDSLDAALGRLGCPEARDDYLGAAPWPHLVVDGAVEADVVATAAGEVESLAPEVFTWQETRRIRKASLSDRSQMGTATKDLVDRLSSEAAVEALRRLTGIHDLVADPLLAFAGVFVTPPGGWQRVHQDFTRHPATRAHNRVVVLLYLSDWSPGHGGELELWDGELSAAPTVVAPLPGRMVVFETDSSTLHGVRTVASGARNRVALGLRYFSTDPSPRPPRPLYRQTVRRPGEPWHASVPTVGEVARMGARLMSIRRQGRRAAPR